MVYKLFPSKNSVCVPCLPATSDLNNISILGRPAATKSPDTVLLGRLDTRVH